MKSLSMLLISFSLIAAFASGPFPSPVLAGLNIPSGYGQTSVLSAAPGNYLGGMDYLSNGNLVYFDGAVVRLYSGTPPGTSLYDPPGTVFGSFVKVVQGSTIYFGESTDMKIYQVFPTGGGTYQTTVQNNFDLESFGSELYISYNPSAQPHARVAKITLPGGSLDTIVGDTAGWSGPIAFDASGNMYYCVPNPNFGQPGVDGLYRFSRSQVVGALGSGELRLSDGQYLGDALDGCFDMAYDDQMGRLFVTTGNNFTAQIEVYDTTTGAVSQFATKTSGTFWSTYLRFRPGSKPFSPYNGPDAGVLSVIQNETVYEISPAEGQQPWTQAAPAEASQIEGAQDPAGSNVANRLSFVVVPALLILLLRPRIRTHETTNASPRA